MPKSRKVRAKRVRPAARMWVSERWQEARLREDHTHVERLDPSDGGIVEERIEARGVDRPGPEVGFPGIRPGRAEGHRRRSSRPEGLAEAQPRTFRRFPGIGHGFPGIG